MKYKIGFLLLYVILFSLSAKKTYKVKMMPIPNIYNSDGVNLYNTKENIPGWPYKGVLYVTDRAPLELKDSNSAVKKPFYSEDRGNAIRVGFANITFSKGDSIDWEVVQNVSLEKVSPRKYPLKVSSISEFCMVNPTISSFSRIEDYKNRELSKDDDTLIAIINRKLAASDYKDINIYVHGFKNRFESPVLISSELWHFMGYEGLFLPFSWATNFNKLTKYFSDIETAVHSGRNLRVFIEFLAKNTDVEHINVIGKSAGGRVVVTAFGEMAQRTDEMTDEEIKARWKIGNLILIGSDYDRGILSNYLLDGLMAVVDRFTIYTSQKDKAMMLPRLIFRKNAIGETINGEIDDRDQIIIDYLKKFKNRFQMIDVTNGDKATNGNGHDYFRKSPWVSSDLLLLLRTSVSAEQRGLVQDSSWGYWGFSDDYPERINKIVKKIHKIEQSNSVLKNEKK